MMNSCISLCTSLFLSGHFILCIFEGAIYSITYIQLYSVQYPGIFILLPCQTPFPKPKWMLTRDLARRGMHLFKHSHPSHRSPPQSHHTVSLGSSQIVYQHTQSCFPLQTQRELSMRGYSTRSPAVLCQSSARYYILIRGWSG
jgi:hypothetical protein